MMAIDILLNQISQSVASVSVSNREQVLALISLWNQWKQNFLKELEVAPVGIDSLGQRIYNPQTQQARGHVLVLNFWPWTGSLESILAGTYRSSRGVDVTGEQMIREHWTRCVDLARGELTAHLARRGQSAA